MVTFSFGILCSCYIYLRLVALGIVLCYTTACSTITKYGMDSGGQASGEISTKSVTIPSVDVDGPPLVVYELYECVDQCDVKGFMRILSETDRLDKVKAWINKEWIDKRDLNVQTKRYPLLHTAIIYLDAAKNLAKQDDFSKLCAIIQALIPCLSVDLNILYCGRTPLQNLLYVGPGLDLEREQALFQSFLAESKCENKGNGDHVCSLVKSNCKNKRQFNNPYDLVAVSVLDDCSNLEDLETFRCLLMEVNAEAKNYFKIFKWGFEKKYPAVVQAALKHYPLGVRAGDEGGYLKTVMKIAVKNNEKAMVKALLDSGRFSVNTLDENDCAVLHLAVKDSKYNVVELMLTPSKG